MTINEARKLVRRCTYKNGWQLKVRQSPLYPTDHMRLEVLPPELSDTECPPDRISLVFFEDIPSDGQSETGVLFALMRLVEMVERHELREWFKFDGIKVSDPHTKGSL